MHVSPVTSLGMSDA